MVRFLTNDQRGRVAEKIMEWGNLVFVGLVIVQIVPGTDKFQPGMIFVGVFGFISAYIYAYMIMKGGEQKI